MMKLKRLAGALRRIAVGTGALLLTGIMTMPALTGYGFLHVLAAEDNDVVYTTEGGTWKPVDDNTWVVVKENGDPARDEDIIATVVKNGDQWEYFFKVKDTDASYYGWEPEMPDGYQTEGKGTRKDPVKSGEEYTLMEEKQYSHTPNISDDGVKTGHYANDLSTNEVVTIPGAKKLHVKLTYGGENATFDWVSLWEGSHPDYTAADNWNLGIRINGKQKFGGGNGTTVECDVDGDTVTFAFKSDDSGWGNGYGYYAVVTGQKFKDIAIVNQKDGHTPEPEVKTGGLTIAKTLSGVDVSDTAAASQKFRFDIALSSEEPALQQKLSGTHIFGDMPVTNGHVIVYLQGGQSVSLSDIPEGVSWKITETEVSGYTSAMTVNGTASGAAGEATGTIAADQMAKVVCTNTKTTAPPTVPDKTGSFKVKKATVNGTDGDSFTFSAALQKLKADTDYTVNVAGTPESVHSNASGMAYLSFALKNGETAEFKDLPIGTAYQIQEEASEYTASYEIKAENGSVLHTVMDRRSNAEVNQPLSTQKETLEENEQALILFTNRKAAPRTDVVELTVNKVWEDQDNAGGIRPDSISIVLYQSVNDTETGDIIARAQLDKAGGWKYCFTDLDRYQEGGTKPYYYTVVEDPVAGYDSQVVKTEAGNIVTATITNTADQLPLGDLKISKTVEGGSAQDDESFRFTVHLTREVTDGGGAVTMVPVKGTFSLDSSEGKGTKTGTVYFDENGDAQIRLKAGESAYITGLPADASYTVAEEASADWALSLDAGSDALTGTIKKDKLTDIRVKNTWTGAVYLTISKTVQGNMGDKTKEFEFTLTLSAPAGTTLPAALTGEKGGESVSLPLTDGKCTFALAHGKSIKISGIPGGSQYSILESGAEEYQVSYTIDGGKASDTISGISLTADTEVSVVNKRNLAVPTLVSMNTVVPLGLLLVGGIVLLFLIWKYMIAPYRNKEHEED